MSIAEIERFAADLKTNAALRAEALKVEAGTSAATPVDCVVAFAATRGYAFTADEAKGHAKAAAKAAGRELTDAELGGVTGGGAASGQVAGALAAAQNFNDQASDDLKAKNLFLQQIMDIQAQLMKTLNGSVQSVAKNTSQ